MAELAREIERVVTAPYAPVLQDLHRLVRHSTPAVLRAWAASKPCQVAPLADVLLSALPCSSAALPLLGAFASVPVVRDALLQRQPVLLDRLLQRGLDDGDPECLHASTALLSSPLPGSTVLPARLAPFIMKLVHQMVQNPCAGTIRPLYEVFSGLHDSPGLLDAVPEEAMASFQTECSKILRNLDDHMGNLLCLATFARIASTRRYYAAPDRREDRLPAWLQNVSQFFGPKRGLKTLDLVVLRVVLACSASCSGLSPAEAVESVRLAVEICDRVGFEQRESWIKSNPSRIAKLCEKVSRDGIDPELQMMGLAFLVPFVPATLLPKEIRSLCHRALLSDDGRNVLRAMPDAIVTRLVDGIFPVFDQSAASEMLRHIISTLQDANPADPGALAATNMAVSFLPSLQRAGQQLERAVRQLFASESKMLYSLLEHFPVQQCQAQCNGSAVCYAALSTARNQLFVDLFGVLFSVAFSGHASDSSSDLSDVTNMLALFMSRVKGNLFHSHGCAFTSKPSSVDIFPLRAASEASSDNAPSRDWRVKMADALLRNARISHGFIIQQVGEICRDLEHRCSDVEAPLRAVAEERDNLAAELEALKRRNRELEIQAEQSSHAISTLQQDIARLEKRATSASVRAEELSARLAAAQKELEDVRRDSQESARSEREKARTRELDLMATLTEREDQLEELQEEVRERTAENEELRRTLDALSKENAAGLETSAALRREISGLKAALEAKTLLCSERDEEVKRLLADKEYLRSEMEQLYKKVEQETSESDRLRSALRAEEESHRSDVATLKEQHDLQVSRMTAEAQQQAALHKEEAKTLRMALQAAESKASKEIQAKNKKIQRLEQKVEALRNERAAKAREFSEAQEHISRLMSVMGFKGAQPEASNTTRKSSRPRSVGVPRSSGAQAEDESFYQTQPPGQESFESTSPSSSGPSPKRPKSSRHSRALPTGSSYDNNYDDSTRPPAHPQGSDRERARRPLSEADRNSPAKSLRSSSSKASSQSTPLESQAGLEVPGEQTLEDLTLSFAEDSIFTSTASS